jgi:hypothetical protein
MRPDSTSSRLRATNTSAKSGGTVGGGVLYTVRLEFMSQGVADWLSRVRTRIRITSILVLRVVKGDEKGTRYLEIYLGHPVPR